MLPGLSIVFCRLLDLERFIIWEVAEQIVAQSSKPLKSARSFQAKKKKYEYLDENRIGDHICYYSDLTKINDHFPNFEIEHSLKDTIQQIVEARGVANSKHWHIKNQYF